MDLEGFVQTPISSTLTCCHAELVGVVNVNDDDYVTFESLTDEGCRVLRLAERHPCLADIVEPLRAIERRQRGAWK